MQNKKDGGNDDDVEDTAEHFGDGGDVGRGEGGDDYIIDGDGVAVLHGVQMVPFNVNVPALMGWQKGCGAESNISGKSHPGEGVVVLKQVKNPILVLWGKVLAMVAKMKLPLD